MAPRPQNPSPVYPRPQRMRSSSANALRTAQNAREWFISWQCASSCIITICTCRKPSQRPPSPRARKTSCITSPALKLRPTNSVFGSYSSSVVIERWWAFMIGWVTAAIRSRKSCAKAAVGPGSGLMKIWLILRFDGLRKGGGDRSHLRYGSSVVGGEH